MRVSYQSAARLKVTGVGGEGKTWDRGAKKSTNCPIPGSDRSF